MADPRPGSSARFDRVRKPDPAHPRRRDEQGKEALFTTAPTSAPTAQIEVRCPRCDVLTGVSILGLVRLLKPPVLWDPVRRRLWTRCPTCDERAWLDVRIGQALRVLLERVPTR